MAALRFTGLPGIELVECDGDPTTFVPATATNPTGDGYRLIPSDGGNAVVVGEDHPDVQRRIKSRGLSGLRGTYPALTQQIQQLPLAILRNPAGDPFVKIDLIERGVTAWWTEARAAVLQAMRSDPDVRVRAVAAAYLSQRETASMAEVEATFLACVRQARGEQLTTVLEAIPWLDYYCPDALWQEVFRSPPLGLDGCRAIRSSERNQDRSAPCR